jgi:twitching motility protein PilT
MIPLQSCLNLATEHKAQEILLQSREPLRLRIGKELVLADSGQMSPVDIRQIVSQVLSEEERQVLNSKSKVQGVKSIGEIAFKFDFQIDFDGVHGSLRLLQNSQETWSFPVMAVESVFKSQGLNLVIGPRKSGKTTSLRQLLNAGGSRNKVIAIFTDEEVPGILSAGNAVYQYPTSQLKSGFVPSSADLVVIDSPALAFCEKALQLAEEGRSVILTLAFWNIEMGLQRMTDLLDGAPESRSRRLAQTLQTALGLRLVSGIETPLQGAFEMLLADADVQTALKELRFGDLSALMRTSAERTGMRSLNQTLFQLLMKRKVELKAAFEASSEPEELDAMLKKVGI